MSKICYMVFATVPDEATATEFAAWLKDGHVAEVLRHGAISGTVVRLDRDAVNRLRVLAQYEFPSRAAFDEYIAVHAPALRADGIRRFPPERGIVWTRKVGEIQ